MNNKQNLRSCIYFYNYVGIFFFRLFRGAKKSSKGTLKCTSYTDPKLSKVNHIGPKGVHLVFKVHRYFSITCPQIKEKNLPVLVVLWEIIKNYHVSPKYQDQVGASLSGWFSFIRIVVIKKDLVLFWSFGCGGKHI